MDVDALLSNLPEFGIGGAVIYLLVYFMRHTSTDRADYRLALKEERQQFAEELAERDKRHAAELTQRDERIERLQARYDELSARLDEERQKRFDLQGTLARMQRGEAWRPLDG